MPSMLDNSNPALADCGQTLNHEPLDQTSSTSNPFFPWQEVPQSAAFGHTSHGPHSEANYSAALFPVSAGGQIWSKPGIWNYEARQDSTFPQSFSSIQSQNLLRFNHASANSFDTDSAIQRPTLPPSPRRCSQGQLWTESAIDNTINGIFTAQPQGPHGFSYFGADRADPAMYSTATNQLVPFRRNMELAGQNFGNDTTVDSYVTDGESKDDNVPYNKLLYQALMEAPEHKLVLRDIYDWIAQNTDKAKDPLNKGWQNSVRHNLSMNGSFKKIELTDPNNKTKKGYIWALEPSAVQHGIQSTTRYRPKPDKKNDQQAQIDPKRQRSGKKGGRATRRSRRLRSLARLNSSSLSPCDRSNGSDLVPRSPVTSCVKVSPTMDSTNFNGLPYWLPTPPLSTQSSIPDGSVFDLSDGLDISETQPSQFLPDDAFQHHNETMPVSNSECRGFEDSFVSNDLAYFI